MAIFYRKSTEHIIVSGKTYPYRDAIKAIGGQFQTMEKIWLLPASEDVLQAVAKLCKSVGGGVLKDEFTASPPSPAAKVPAAYTTTPEAPVKNGLTVSELMAKAQMAITATFPKAVWVLGELQNCASRKQGLFFELADLKTGSSQSATITIKATLWSSTLQQLTHRHGKKIVEELLQDGLQVRLLCQVGFYRDRGQVTLNVLDLDPDFTRGALALQREQLLKELRQKGLDVKNKELPLTAFPFKVGLISAEGSRAQSDFLDQLFTYKFPGQVIFYPAQMQGEKTLTEVVAGIKALSAKKCDLIVITRGGGSAADLRWFDSREVAYAIAGSGVPIVAAIGHHDDVCVAEEIAYRREKTPTAAADYLLHIFKTTRERLDQATRQLGLLIDRVLERENRNRQILRDRLLFLSSQAVERESKRLAHCLGQFDRSFSNRLAHMDRLLQSFCHRLKDGARERLSVLLQRESDLKQKWRQAISEAVYAREEEWRRMQMKIAALDPKPWLAKGWTQLFHDTHERISSAKDVTPGQKVKARLMDALLTMTVNDVESKHSQGQKP